MAGATTRKPHFRLYSDSDSSSNASKSPSLPSPSLAPPLFPSPSPAPVLSPRPLATLPMEVIEHIFSFVKGNDTLTWALVSPNFAQLARIKLYRRININACTDPHDHIIIVKMGRKVPQLVKIERLAESLELNPALGKYIFHFKIQVTKFEEIPYESELVALFQRIFRTGENLQSLDLGIGFEPGNSFRAAFNLHVDKVPESEKSQSYLGLKTLTLRQGTPSKFTWDLVKLMTTLQELHIINSRFLPWDPRMPKRYHPCAHLRLLSLTQLDTKIAIPLLNACAKSLEHLTLTAIRTLSAAKEQLYNFPKLATLILDQDVQTKFIIGLFAAAPSVETLQFIDDCRAIPSKLVPRLRAMPITRLHLTHIPPSTKPLEDNFHHNAMEDYTDIISIFKSGAFPRLEHLRLENAAIYFALMPLIPKCIRKIHFLFKHDNTSAYKVLELFDTHRELLQYNHAAMPYTIEIQIREHSTFFRKLLKQTAEIHHRTGVKILLLFNGRSYSTGKQLDALLDSQSDPVIFIRALSLW